MHVVPGPWFLLALNGAVLLAAVGVAAYVVSRRDPAAAADWGAGALALAREVQRAVEAAGRPADADRLARRLLPLAGRIHRHVREAPRGVDQGVYRRLFALGVACQRVAVEHRPATRVDGPFLEDRLETLGAEADALAAAVESG